MDIKNIDHIVLSVANVDASVKFYEDVLGMQAFCFTGADGQERKAVKFGATKINFHDLRAPVRPNAKIRRLARQISASSVPNRSRKF